MSVPAWLHTASLWFDGMVLAAVASVGVAIILKKGGASDLCAGWCSGAACALIIALTFVTGTHP
jgi:hypothetical protein